MYKALSQIQIFHLDCPSRDLTAVHRFCWGAAVSLTVRIHNRDGRHQASIEAAAAKAERRETRGLPYQKKNEKRGMDL